MRAVALTAMLVAACGDNLEVPPIDAAPVPYDPWTLVVLPDTQGYTYQYPAVWYAQTRWIADHATEWNVKLIAHVGDITEWNTIGEWGVAETGLADLDGVAPLMLVPGNHDYDVSVERVSRISQYWTPDELRAKEHFGGLYQADRTDNSYIVATIRDQPWLVLGLEWGPRDAVLDWAAGVLDAHSDHHVVIVTHAYTYLDNRRYDWATHGNAQRYNPHNYVGVAWPEVNDGEEIWQKLIATRANVDVVLSGHVPDEGVGRLSSTAANGTVVHQLLADYQSGPMGGNGYLRLMTFHGDRIDVRTYSPYLDAYETSPEHAFTLPWSP
jgi:predicted phosphodiesterase